MDGAQIDLAGLLGRPDPDGANPASQRKWVLANQVARPGELQSDRARRERPPVAFRVGDAEHNAGGVTAAGDKLQVVRLDVQVGVRGTSRIAPRDGDHVAEV